MSDVRDIEVSIEEAKASIEAGNAMQRLIKNADFKKIFTDNYFSDYAAGLVMQKAMPQMQNEERQKDIDNAIIAVGETKQFILSILARGKQSEVAIESMHAEHELALTEESEGE